VQDLLLATSVLISYYIYTALLERIINKTPRLKVFLKALEASKSIIDNIF
jgi:hypothetical protein